MNNKIKLPKKLSIGEESLAAQLGAYRIKFHREFKFHPERRWRFDFALSAEHGVVAIEVDGGTNYGKSRHSYGQGYQKDCEKLNEAAALGWKVFRFTTQQVVSGEAIDFIRRVIA